MLVPINLPPGVMKNGTEYQAKGRWYDAALVRWRNGAMGPVGGWQQWSSSSITGVARGMLPWRDNAGDRWLALGTAEKLYVYDSAGALTDITPVGLTAGAVDADDGSGYGGNNYGTWLYGTPRPDTGTITPATTWSLDTWGQYLVACSSADGKLWEWTLNTANDAAQISGAPTSCKSLVVTSEQFLFALGAGGDARKVQWCDQEDNTTWTPSATNQAGSILLQTRGEIVCGRRVRGATLILTTTDAHIARYIGQPFVFSFDKVGEGCGIVAPHAVATVDNQVVWLGERGFFAYDGFVRRVESEVIDYFFENVASLQISKTFAFHNSQFDEIWWVYPSDTENECDSYIAWNYVENHWSIGSGIFERSAGVDRVVFARPMLVGVDGYVYEHETGYDYGSANPYASSGPVELGVGEQVMAVKYIYPDENTLGDVEVTLRGKTYPTDSWSSYGPYTAAAPTPVRMNARQVSVRVDAARSADWRLGVLRMDVSQSGKR